MPLTRLGCLIRVICVFTSAPQDLFTSSLEWWVFLVNDFTSWTRSPKKIYLQESDTKVAKSAKRYILYTNSKLNCICFCEKQQTVKLLSCLLEKDYSGIVQRFDAIERSARFPLLVVATVLAWKFEYTHHQQSVLHHWLGHLNLVQHKLAFAIQHVVLAGRIYNAAFSPSHCLWLYDNRGNVDHNFSFRSQFFPMNCNVL